MEREHELEQPAVHSAEHECGVISDAGAGDRGNDQRDGGLTGRGGLQKSGTGTLNLSGANSFGGATAVTAGTLVYAANFTSGTTLMVSNGATARVSNNTTSALVLKVTGLDTNTTGRLDLM